MHKREQSRGWRWALDRPASFESRTYPGDLASHDQLLALADEYRQAALVLRERGVRKRPLTWAPFRLTAIQAVELYLNVYLLRKGYSASQVRGLQHDLGLRSSEAITAGLKLRQRTTEHLQRLSDQREYLVTRYGPELASTTSQINRLAATLEEVARKVAPLPVSPTPTLPKR